MPDLSPPSSRRDRRNRPLECTIESNAMRRLFDSVYKAAKRGRYVFLVVPEPSMHEVVSFGAKATERRGAIRPPLVCRPDVPSLLEENGLPVSFERCLLLLRADQLPDRLQRELLQPDLESPTRPRPLVIAVVPSTDALDRLKKVWPGDLLRRFNNEPFIWPEMGDRHADKEGVALAVCRQFTTEDGNRHALLSYDALDHVLGIRWDTVAQVRNYIRDGFDRMLRAGRDEITVAMLKGIYHKPSVVFLDSAPPPPA